MEILSLLSNCSSLANSCKFVRMSKKSIITSVVTDYEKSFVEKMSSRPRASTALKWYLAKQRPRY